MDEDDQRTGTIVVGVDGSESSADALRWAAAQARLTGAELEVVTAWSQPTVWGRTPTFPPGWDPQEVTRTRLADLVQQVLGDDPGFVVRQVVVEGHAAASLVAAAEHADLLVLGRRGDGAVTGALFGSVSMHCMVHAPCPVVIAHHRRSDAG